MTDHDPVERPSHYRRGGIELWDALEAWGLDGDGYLMQAVQYIFRHQFKGDPLGDLEKAKRYLDRRIECMKRWRANDEDEGLRQVGGTE